MTAVPAVNPAHEMITIDQVAAMFAVSPKTVERWVRQGRVERCGNGLFRSADVRRLRDGAS